MAKKDYLLKLFDEGFFTKIEISESEKDDKCVISEEQNDGSIKYYKYKKSELSDSEITILLQMRQLDYLKSIDQSTTFLHNVARFIVIIMIIILLFFIRFCILASI